MTGAGATMSRMAMFEADMPVTVPVYGVNRQCASGLQAIASIADSIHRSSSSVFLHTCYHHSFVFLNLPYTNFITFLSGLLRSF